MRYLFFSFLVLLTFIESACNRSNNDTSGSKESDVIVIKKEYILKEINLYKANPKLYPILDSIIQSVKDCPGLKENEFVYCIYIEEDSLTNISIELRKKKRIYCSQIGGLFLYKNSAFKLSNMKHKNDLFINTGKTIRFKCQKDNSLIYDYDDYVIAIWKYVLKNRKPKCISYSICGKGWRNENFF